MLKVHAVEGLMYLLFSTVLVGVACFFPNFLVIVTTGFSATFLVSYTMAFALVQRTTVALVGAVGVAFPALLHLASIFMTFNENVLISFVGVILIIMIIGFGAQLVREEQSDSINTISHSIVISVLSLCSYGFVMANNMYNGIMTAFVALCVLPYIAIGLMLLFRCGAIALLHYGFKRTLQANFTNSLSTFIVGCIVLLLTDIFFFFTFESVGIGSVSYLHVGFSAFILLFSYAVTWLQFGTGKFLSAALLRVTFPIVTTGIFTYIVALFTWS